MNAPLRLLWASLLGVSATCGWLATGENAQAQTRDYNPMRRGTPTTDAQLQEFTAPPRRFAPAADSAPVRQVASGSSYRTAAASNNQWRSTRQPVRPRSPAPALGVEETQTSPMMQGPPPGTMHGVPPESIMAPPGSTHEMPAPQFSEHSVGEGPWNDGPACGSGCAAGCCDGGDCGEGCCGGHGGNGFGFAWTNRCNDCCNFDFLSNRCWPRDVSVFGGVHGFKGPPDIGQNGNFGFHEGVNIGGLIRPMCALGYQVGAQFVHSNFHGDTVQGADEETRNQFFFTAGLFRRAICGCGLQGGVVFDLLHDEYYVNMELGQIRGELSYVGPRLREVGFMFATWVEDDSELNQFGVRQSWEPIDQYAFFYRRMFDCGGSYRFWAGFTGESEGLLGGDAQLPINDGWALSATFNYLIPEGGGRQDFLDESWNVGVNLIWYPGCQSRCIGTARPLFNVADNGSFMIRRLR